MRRKSKGEKNSLCSLSCNSRYLLRSRPVSHVTAPRIRKSFGPSPPSSTRSEEKLVEDDNVSDGLYRGNNPQSTITARREREKTVNDEASSPAFNQDTITTDCSSPFQAAQSIPNVFHAPGGINSRRKSRQQFLLFCSASRILLRIAIISD